MTRVYRYVLVAAAACLTLVLSTPASAQDLTLGYQFQSLGNGDWTNLPMGLAADVSAPLSKSISGVAQFDWSRKTEQDTLFGSSVEASSRLTTFGAGLRFTRNRAGSGARPYVQLLLGTMTASVSCRVDGDNCFGEPIDSETKGMVQGGAGVSVPMSKKVRGVVQADYRHVFSTDGTNSIRVFGGLRFAFK